MTQELSEKESLLYGNTGRMFLLVTLAIFGFKLGQKIIPPLLPTIINDLSITPFLAGVALSGMQFMGAVSQYPGGRYSDLSSRKSVLIAGICCGILGFGLIINSMNYLFFTIGVLILGLGLGAYQPAARALISEMFKKKRGRAFGVHFIASDIAGLVAAIFAMLITIQWRDGFVPSVFLLITILFGTWYISRERIVIKRVRLNLHITLTRLFTIRTIRWAAVAYSLIMFSRVGITNFLAAFLVEVHDFTIGQASMAFLLLYGFGMVVRPLSGWFSDRIPRLAVVSLAIFLSIISLALLVISPTYQIALLSVIIYTVGQRSFPAPFQAYLMDHFPDSSMGGDLGVVRTFYIGIGSLGPAYIGIAIGRVGYEYAYLSTVPFMILAVLITLGLSRPLTQLRISSS